MVTSAQADQIAAALSATSSTRSLFAASREGSVGAPSGAPTSARSYTDIAYASSSPAQVLDLYVPASSAPVPLVIMIHGGAFSGGDKTLERSFVSALEAEGYAVASLGYRLAGEAGFPAGARDVKAAVRFLRANASAFHLDPDRFAAWGESAGAWFAVMLGVTGDQPTVFDDDALGHAGVSSAVQAVVDWYGPVDFGAMDDQQRASPPAACPTSWLQHGPAASPESIWLGGALASVPALLGQSNLVRYVPAARALPAFVAYHGDDDCEVPHAQAGELDAALAAVGASSELNVMPGYGHRDPRFAESCTTPSIQFLNRTFGR